MTIHETMTTLAPARVIEQALDFFEHTGAPEVAFVEEAGEGYLRLHMNVGEIVIGALVRENGTWVRGSASRAPQLVSRFLMTLGAPLQPAQTVNRRGTRLTRGILSETFVTDRPKPKSRPRLPARAA